MSGKKCQVKDVKKWNRAGRTVNQTGKKCIHHLDMCQKENNACWQEHSTLALKLPQMGICSSSSSAELCPSSLAAERPASTSAMSATLVRARHVGQCI